MSQTSYTSRSRTCTCSRRPKSLRKATCARPPRRDGESVAEMVKVVAAVRGWEHGSRRELFNVVDRLVVDTRDEDIRSQFLMAGQLHTNFYEGWLSRAAVEATLSNVTRFVEKMEGLLAAS